jgi:hypothetical protein
MGTAAASAEFAALKAQREIERERSERRAEREEASTDAQRAASAAEARIIELGNQIEAMREQLGASKNEWKLQMVKRDQDHEVRVCVRRALGHRL